MGDCFKTTLGDWFKTTVGTRQGEPISANILISYLERVMDSVRDNGTGISVHGYKINNLKFSEDIVLLEHLCFKCPQVLAKLALHPCTYRTEECKTNI